MHMGVFRGGWRKSEAAAWRARFVVLPVESVREKVLLV